MKKEATILLIYILVSAFTKTIAQPVGIGNPVYFQHFGEGNIDPTIVGPPLPAGTTDFTYSTELCPPPNSYSIVRRINYYGCFNNEWIPLGSDHTGDFDPNMDFGYMMLVNHSTHYTPKLVYLDTIRKTLCPGANYRFSVAIINVDKPGSCGSYNTFPVFVLTLENELGQIQFTDTTDAIGYASDFFGYKFGEYGFGFVMPASVNKLVVKITALPSSADCGEDFAIDDVLITTAGPQVKIAFDNEPSTTLVKNVCFQHNKTISITGIMDAFYSNPALQWQQSTDGGYTWVDIPGATDNTYSNVYSTPDSFLFRLSGAESANIANLNCRVVSNILKVRVDDIPKNYTISNNSPVCAGQDLKFNAEGGANYIWTGPNGFYENIYYPHIYFSSLADSGMYYVDIYSAGGCVAKDSTYATVIGTDVDAWPDTTICKGNSVRLFATKGVSYVWSPAKGFPGSTLINPVVTPEITTVYTVKVTDSIGCSDTANVKVKVLNAVEVKAIISGTEYLCRSYDSAFFFDKSLGKIVNWKWNFNNGNTSVSPQPPVQYYSITGNSNDYVIQLAVRDTAGCTDTAYHFVHVADNCYIAVPSAFTPNNDGLNDWFYPLNAYKATNLVFRVYNRMGMLVFETKDWTKKWDGRLRGQLQQTGVYMWILEYNDASGKRISQKGTTLLIR